MPFFSSRSRPYSSNRSERSCWPFSIMIDALLHFVVKNADLVLQVLLHHVELFLLDRLGAVVLLDALAGEDLHADDDALDARRADERRVADVAGLLAEDRAEQLLFRRQLRLALRRDLADQDVARLDVGADADDAALVEVAQERLPTRSGCRA